MFLAVAFTPAGSNRVTFIRMVPEVGFEPTRSYLQWILNPPRLPFRHSGIDEVLQNAITV